MIVVQKTITADDSDVLASTDLSNIPGAGVLEVFIASTQNDTVFTFTGPGNEPIVRLQKVMLRTNGMPVIKDDVPYTAIVIQGGHYVLNVDIVTAATVSIIANYTPADEL